MRNILTAMALTLATAATAQTDPHQWLEEVEGSKALEWVRARNAESLPQLESTPGFAQWRARAEAQLNDPRRIAAPSLVTPTTVFNFWRDPANIRGVWRSSPRAAYDAGKPVWTTLIDMDALAKAENANWQWGGATCLPDASRCLVGLSNGGKDAEIIREYDTTTRSFVSDRPFTTTEAKQTLAWLDRDTLLVATDYGPGTLTTSGYPRQARLWRRGTPLASAPTLLTADEKDMGVWPTAYGDGPTRRAVIAPNLTFWTSRLHHLASGGALVASPLPDDADFRFIATVAGKPTAVALLRTAWRGIPAGSVVGYAVPADGRVVPEAVRALYSPSGTEAVSGVAETDDAIYVGLLADVSAKLKRLTPTASGWAATEVALPANSTLSFVESATKGDSLYMAVSSFIEPTRLMLAENGAAPRTLATAPTFFDAAKYNVTQRFARSSDGTRVPYFVVRPKGATGPLPTLLWAYGGFEIPSTPGYLNPEMQFFTEAGGQYIVANIRGGGEYGPAWHQSALKANRQRSYDDLHAVAADAKAQGLAGKLAVHGRSNGGLMAAVAYTQRPQLYDGALVGVPLADMQRYHLLLAGASWMGEYGDPETPAEWAFISRYSPYQNIRADAKYPRVFFYTSTKDDRVHPGHARKMAARMIEQKHPIYYYENTDGGHAGVANLKESAYRSALMMAYLTRELK